MISLIVSAVSVGIIVSLLLYVHVMYIIPRLPKSPIVRMFLGVPTACAPVAIGFFLSAAASRHSIVRTENARGGFMLIWFGVTGVSMLFMAIKTESLKKAGKYWRWKG